MDEDVLLEEVGGRGGVVSDHGIAELAGGSEVEELAFEEHGLEGDAVEVFPEFAAEVWIAVFGIFGMVGGEGEGGGDVVVEVDGEVAAVEGFGVFGGTGGKAPVAPEIR